MRVVAVTSRVYTHMNREVMCISHSMSVTAEMLKPFLEGWTLKQIIEAKRLYFVDLKILEDLPTKDDNEVRPNIVVDYRIRNCICCEPT